MPQLCDTYLPVEIVEEFETIALQFHCCTNIKATFLSDQVTLLNLVTLHIQGTSKAKYSWSYYNS